MPHLRMEITLHIIKRRSEHDGSYSYSARLTINLPQIEIDPNCEEEVFWVAATGKSFFGCLDTVRTRAEKWAQDNGVLAIGGLTGNDDCPLILRAGNEVVEIQPIIYNDWILEAHL